MAASRAMRVEKPTLSATNSNVNVSVNMGDRLEAARLRAKLVGPVGIIEHR